MVLKILACSNCAFTSCYYSSSSCTILDNWDFENFILAYEPFSKALLIFKTCVLVNNSLCGKLVSSLELPIKFDEWIKVTTVPFFIADFNCSFWKI